MTRPAPFRSVLLSAVFAACFMLAGCGIKGPLELPSDAQASTDTTTTGKGRIPEAAKLPGYQPSVQDRKTAKQLGMPAKPDQPFVLDPLLN